MNKFEKEMMAKLVITTYLIGKRYGKTTDDSIKLAARCFSYRFCNWFPNKAAWLEEVRNIIKVNQQKGRLD